MSKSSSSPDIRSSRNEQPEHSLTIKRKDNERGAENSHSNDKTHTQSFYRGSPQQSSESDSLQSNKHHFFLPDIPKPHFRNNSKNELKEKNTTPKHSHAFLKVKKNSTLLDDTYHNISQFRMTVGERIRRVIYKIEDTVGPLIKKIIPNFIMAHYVYILLWVIVGSIVLYPSKNLDYIDCLMFAAGAATQGGLAPQQLNDVKLYQQITIYMVCMFTTPIFIHGSLTFIRLYWYEKRFDDIKEKSINQYKMRRSKTIANLRSETNARTMSANYTNSHRNFDSHNAQEGLTSRMKRFENMKNFGNSDNIDPLDTENITTKNNNYNSWNVSQRNKRNDNLEISNDHNDDNDCAVTDYDDGDENDKYTTNKGSGRYDVDKKLDDSNEVFTSKINTSLNHDHAVESPTTNIKFGELPKPFKKKERDIAPRDLYMSISALQNDSNSDFDDEMGPALHFKSPHELEKDKRKVPLRRRKHRKILREKKLKELKKKALPLLQTEKSIVDTELAEQQGRNFDFTSQTNIDTNADLTKKEKARRAMSSPMLEKPDIVSHQELPLDFDSTAYKPGFKHFQRSHTLHMPEFSKKLFSNFDNSNVSPGQENVDEFPYLKRFKSRRPSIFTKRRTYSNLDQLSDDDFVNNYLTNVPTNYLSWKPTVGRNSKFIALTKQQKIELGGVEYQSMKLLGRILVAYYLGFHILAFVLFVPYVTRRSNYAKNLRSDGVSPAWWGFFSAMSSFNDLGYTLNATSMALFDESAYVQLISGAFILIGNTAFPICLRFIIWLMKHFTKPLTLSHDSLSFLLDHPRRCFTLLFPSGPTWWLFAVLLLLNFLDWILFIILDFGREGLSYIPRGYQILCGLYQAICTRTAGFNVVNLASLNPAIQVSYMVMMYISVLPLAISIRRTNVYEEQSLGVYEREDEDHTDSKPRLKYIGDHLRKQLSFDLWFLFLAIFIICICEAGRIQSGDVNFTVFQIMFELTSAYGTVGLSLGYPNKNTSFCGEFSKISKLVVVATLIRGRHRGLPNSIDRAIMLSDEKLNLRDDLEAYHAMRRTATTMSNTETMFPSITKVATGQRRQTIDRQPTISENIRQGVIPWGDILTKVGHLLGKTVANILTVSGAPKEEKYARQMTRYSTFDDYPLRSRSTSQYTRRNSNFEDRNMGYDNYHDNDDDISFNSSVGERESVPLKNYPPFSDGRDGKNNHSQTYSQEEKSVRNYYPVRSSNGANGDSESIVTPESYVSDLHSSISSKKRKLN